MNATTFRTNLNRLRTRVNHWTTDPHEIAALLFIEDIEQGDAEDIDEEAADDLRMHMNRFNVDVAEDVSGYSHCECRDCVEITIGGGYCDDCEDTCGPEFSTSTECQSEHAYSD